MSQTQGQIDSTKRQAMTGQWRTPPVPQFAAGSQQQQQQQLQQQQPPPPAAAHAPASASAGQQPQRTQQQQQQQQPQVSFISTNLPTSSDDYAIALQEAYRRGAEAAMSYGGGGASTGGASPNIGSTNPTAVPMPTAVSCPNFDELRPDSESPVSYPLGEEPDPQQEQQPPQFHHHHHPPHHAGPIPSPGPPSGGGANVPNPLDSSANVPNPLMASSSNAPPPLPSAHVQQPHQHHHQQQQQPGVQRMTGDAPLQPPPHHQQQHHHRPHTHPPTLPSQQSQPTSAHQQVHHVSHAPPVAPVQHQHHPLPVASNTRITHASAPGSTASPSAAMGVGMSPPPSAAAAASGPRSLSLPDMASYAARAQAEEEKRKKRLARNRASARLRRLRKKNLVDSYEGEVGVLETSLQKLKAHEWGEPNNTNESILEALSMERGQQSIDDEQRASLIKELLKQQRDQVAWIKEVQTELSTLQWFASATSGAGGSSVPQDEEEAELARELNEILHLSDDQKSSIIQATDGMEKEVEAVDTVDECLKAMEENEFLLNVGVTDITKQFMSILHPNQISKFLLWTDSNSEQLEQLDYVYAPPKDAPLPNAPVFTFGMDGDYQGEGGGKDDGGGQ